MNNLEARETNVIETLELKWWEQITERPVKKKEKKLPKKVNPNSLSEYTGWHKWCPTSDEWMEFEISNHTKVPFDLLENEYLLVYDESEPDRLCGTYIKKKGKLQKIGRSSITIKSCDSGVRREETTSKKSTKTYLPRNDEQVWAFDLMKDRDIPIKLITGTWGTGKTMLLTAEALELLENGVIDKIYWIRNNVDAKGSKDLGALPGEINDKLGPFLGPFEDHAGTQRVRSMIDNGTLIIQPLNFLRGRNLEHSLILCSESENLTRENMQLIIARAAEGTEVWFDADCRQRDAKIFEQSMGVEKMIEAFKDHKLFGYVHLTVSERSEVAAMADLLNE